VSPRVLVLALVVTSVVTGACREGGVVPRQQVVGGDPANGPRVLAVYGCGSCHVIPGVRAATGRVGPPLTDFADRGYIAGRRRNEPNALVAWIRAPQETDPETAMPNLGVPEKDARDMAAYLYTLSSDPLGPPHVISPRVLPSH
jgi:cytochrome c